MDNQIWAETIIKELIQQKVRVFCITPGSRSTPLAIAISEHPLATKVVHFDERGAAFYAFGYAKASGAPVCVLTTSGSAVGNLMPAVMEAAASNVPLILLTADRPFELHECGANQTANQIDIFGCHARYATSLPPASEAITNDCLRRHVAFAVQKALSPLPGPVQINCMLREPLYIERSRAQEQTLLSKLRTYIPQATFESDFYEQIALEMSRYERGVIIAGELPPSHTIDALVTLSRRLQWPLFADILSNVRSHGKQANQITYFDQILEASQHLDKLAPQAVLHLGGPFTSKPLHQLLSTYRPEKYVHVHRFDQRVDPFHLATDRIVMNPVDFCKTITPYVKGSTSSIYMQTFEELQESASERIDSFFASSETIGEMELIRFLSANIEESEALFFSNSMPIRDANSYFFPTRKSGPIFGKRGLAGIDGNIATAIGMCEALKKRLLAVMGDQTFLHDLNSLALLKKNLPLQLVVVNNGGGGIFSFLPVREKKDIFDSLFACAHAMNFEAIATQFDIQYFKPKTPQEFEETFLYNIPPQAPAIIEIETNREQNFQAHKRLSAHMKGFDKKTGLKKLEKFGLYAQTS